jgi:hypothetical protein
LLVGINGVSLMAIQRTVPDLAVSIASGKDCSLAHLDHDAPYCSPPEPKPVAPPHCTRSLGGVVDCWDQAVVPPGQLVADQRPLTDAQDKDRERSWFARWVGLW